MIAQVTAAALASENKSLAHPASVDSLPTSANQEDHVSMATFAARRLAADGRQHRRHRRDRAARRRAGRRAARAAGDVAAARRGDGADPRAGRRSGTAIARSRPTSPPRARWSRAARSCRSWARRRSRLTGDGGDADGISRENSHCDRNGAAMHRDDPRRLSDARFADRVIRAPRGTDAHREELAHRGAAADADEQPRSRGRREPEGARRLRRHRPRRAQLGVLRRDRRGAARARRRRVAADPVGQAGRRVQDASPTRRAC